MQIALFGGGFDPPHLGHLQIALHILEEKLADEVWFIPVRKHPFGKQMVADHFRVKMLELLLNEEDHPDLTPTQLDAFHNLKINTYEIDREETSYSFNTLEHFATTYPQHSFSWIIGSDNLAFFHKWYKANELANKYPVFVYPRTGFPFVDLQTGMIPLKKMPAIDISSTDIRYKIQHHLSVKNLISAQEESFIRDHHLYK